MQNGNPYFNGCTQNNKADNNRKREAINRANNLLNFKIDYSKTTVNKRTQVEQRENIGSFQRVETNKNSSFVSVSGQTFINSDDSLKERGRQEMADVGKERASGSMSEKEKITTKLLIATTDNKIGFNLFLKDTEKKIMTMQFYENSPKALNGELLKKIMRAVESYIREAQRNMEEE